MVAYPEKNIIQAYSFVTVYCVNFTIFLCVTLVVSFSRGSVPLKGKADHARMGVGGVLISLTLAVSQTTKVCAAWPVRRQTYGYLPCHRASPPFGRYQIVLLGDRGTWVLASCQSCCLAVHRLGVERSNLRPLDLESDTLTTTPPSHLCPSSQ